LKIAKVIRENRMSKEKVGFIGLGIMGKSMAGNLIRRGFDIVVYNRSREPLEALQNLGAKVAASSKEVGELCNIIIVMVFSAEQAEEVILGKEGLLEGVRNGSLIVIMSTVGPSFCNRAAKMAAEKGVGLIDAPVAGGPGRAVEGTLTVLIGGEDQFVKRCWHIFEAMGKHIFHVSNVVGVGQIVKLANNLITNSGYIATTEAIALVTKAGVNFERFLEIARTSSGINWAVLGNHWKTWRKQKLESGPDANPWAVVQKDLGLAVDASREFGLNLKHLEFIYNMDTLELIRNDFKGDVEK